MALTLIGSPILDITTADTAVCDATVTSGITSTYSAYEFHWVNIHPETDNTEFQFQVETDAADYDHPMITTYVQAHNDESGGSPTVAYSTGDDQATAGDTNGVLQTLAKDVGAGEADQSTSGILTLYDPSSATFAKHFVSTSNNYQGGDTSVQTFVAGYVNITAAITRVQFKMSSGDIDSGTIKMFGVT